MRLKKVKGAKEKIEKSQLSIDFLSISKNPLIFNNNNPIHMEIGVGKGQHIVGLAKSNPNINYIGVEMFDSVLVRAIEKAEEANIDNLKFILCDASKLDEKFNNYFSRIYLTFSDPWPKNKHEKRRLTSSKFLDIYKNLLTQDGLLSFKTDNSGLFEYSVKSLNNYGCQIEEFSIDLHNSIYSDENIQTEYEERFSSYGEKIKHIVVKL